MDIRQQTVQYINEKIKNKQQAEIIENSIYDYMKKTFIQFTLESPEHKTEYIFKSRSINESLI